MSQTQPQQLKIIYFQETFPYANSALLFPKTPHKNNFTQKERNFLHISGIKLWESKIKSLKGISKNKKGIKVTETPTYTLQQLQATIWQITAKKKKKHTNLQWYGRADSTKNEHAKNESTKNELML